MHIDPVRGTPITATLARLVEIARTFLKPEQKDLWEISVALSDVMYDIESGVVAGVIGLPIVDEPLPGELLYLHHPLEFVPFMRNAGDALTYGWVMHAPELEPSDFACGGYAPVDDSADWIGDDSSDAIRNLLLARELYPDGTSSEPVGEALRAHPMWRAIVDGLRLDMPPQAQSPVGFGARSNRAIVPQVPVGYHFEPTHDGIGVLAPEAAFDRGRDLDLDFYETDRVIAVANELVRVSAPASALWVLKNAERVNFNDDLRRIITAMQEPLAQLGRDVLVRRADQLLAALDQVAT